MVASSALTSTEQRVADAVARGLTNQQIADALGMAVQTVKNHLSTIFVKLGVTSRTQLAIQIINSEQDRRGVA